MNTVLCLIVSDFFDGVRSRRQKLKVLEDRLRILEQRIEELEAENDVTNDGTRRHNRQPNFNSSLNSENNSMHQIKRILSKRSTWKKMSNSDLSRPLRREEAVKIYCRVKSPSDRALLGTRQIANNNNVLTSEQPNLTVDVRQNRFIFNSLRQSEVEPVSQYIAKLKSHVAKCQYGDMADEILLDKIIYSVRDPNLQETLRTKRGITLEEAVSICQRPHLYGGNIP